ncbi:MAG: hypothetical protein HOC63_15865 [Rhodospirillales bacterium]|jgi:hypothetical protein|nr:hypothetical protein [Rhodospirillales bacterium]MBT4040874.1 hypothetical protein [Rhodospirillales bacterium]MBT4628151.1 hypothetical protein [Rhodospirillales bacterium]MBT5351963.1 hypothetical protein [Rhodospirillales bacterium]MBT5521124.1 hypothetical protein [Rhodospirillales bacterium]
MYPVSFDNPNGRARPHRAANHQLGDASNGNTKDPRITVFAEEDRLLVVECRTGDRWRVALCTKLEDLDDALDTVRSLQQAEGTDEVSLTIEVSGHQGRESRREVVRFSKETAQAATISAPLRSSLDMPPLDMHAMEAAIAAVAPVVKMPDISLDDMILPQTPDIASEIESQTARSDEVTLSNLAWEEDVIRTHGAANTANTANTDSEDIPAFLKVESPHVDEPDVIDVAEEEPQEASDIPAPDPFMADHFESRRRTPQSFTTNNNRHSWIDDLLDNGSAPVSETFDDDEGFADRLESPMFARENGLTAKVLVFTGMVALLVLGGALAELLAVDITSSANAQSGVQTRVLDISQN